MTEDGTGSAPAVGVGAMNVLAGLSANIEYTRQLRPGSAKYEPGKHAVHRVTPYTDSQGNEAFEITPLDGDRFTIPVSGQATTVASGSSIIVAIVLRELGAPGTTICAPVGGGDGARSLERSISERGFGSLLFHGGNGTARTLTLLPEPGGESTLFCAKPPDYRVPEELMPKLQAINPRLVVLTGVKVSDLPLAENVFQIYGGARRVLLPNQRLVCSPDHRPQLLALMALADVVQLNEAEATDFLGRPFTPDDISEIADAGARITIVTRAANGAIMRKHGSHWVEHQPTPVQVVDSSGAGDVHLATFVYYRFVHPGSLPARVCLAMAGWVASETVRHIGPWSGIPGLEARAVALEHAIRDYG